MYPPGTFLALVKGLDAFEPPEASVSPKQTPESNEINDGSNLARYSSSPNASMTANPKQFWTRKDIATDPSILAISKINEPASIVVSPGPPKSPI